MPIEIKNKVGNTVDVYVYGDIEEIKWYEEDVTPTEFKQIENIDAETIRVFINSAGGSVFAGFTIYNILKRHKAHVETYVDGVAASSAATIYQAGDKRVIPINGMLFIHNPMSISMGYASDMRKAADDLDSIGKVIRNVYTEKTGQKPEKIAEMMENETWIDQEMAINLGFADEITEEKKINVTENKGDIFVNNLKIDNNKYKYMKKANFKPQKEEKPINYGQYEIQLAENKLKLIEGELINGLV